MHQDHMKGRYGTTPGSLEDISRYFQSLKIIIGADGEIARAELAALLQLMRSLNLADDLITEVEAFDITGAELGDHLPLGADRAVARMLLYDAIRLSASDGLFHDRERDAVATAAAYLRIDDAMARTIENLIELESAVTQMRHGIFRDEQTV